MLYWKCVILYYGQINRRKKCNARESNSIFVHNLDLNFIIFISRTSRNISQEVRTSLIRKGVNVIRVIVMFEPPLFKPSLFDAWSIAQSQWTLPIACNEIRQ